MSAFRVQLTTNVGHEEQALASNYNGGGREWAPSESYAHLEEGGECYLSLYEVDLTGMKRLDLAAG